MSAYFSFEQSSPSGALQHFVFRLDDPDKVEQARHILTSGEELRVHVQGTVIPKAADYNPGWGFHLDPASIGFFEMQIEVCDANASYVERHLDEVGGSFLPNSFWCPWSSRLAAEVEWPTP